MKFTLYTAAAALLAVLSTTDVMADAPGCSTVKVTLNQNAGYLADVRYDTCSGQKEDKRIPVSKTNTYDVKKGGIFSVVAESGGITYQNTIQKNTIVNCAGVIGTSCTESYPN